ncbi:DUF2511 domain-containing protein [Streptomyces sp. XD-27]|uniref:DUF2511 domain-containing protein n=1 Tax=Streptomyces sp. XD-27 TaxID=3062779 RepID=UPI0026F479B1|nr:DUF2511 domain-containing protein [Streptomyces sp. XD-27]WKX74137.1 DUF2511 domain-containing protein [Streptomyces sp. XD-27]
MVVGCSSGESKDDSSTAPPPSPSASAQAGVPPEGAIKDRVWLTAGDVKVWPFTVDQGGLRCREGAVTFMVDGTEYALNGTAKKVGFPSVEPVWAEDPELGSGLRVSLSEVLEIGQRLC